MADLINGFSENLRYMRMARRLSVKELGHQLQISPSMISRYESNERLPSFKILIKIATFFNISTDFLLGMNQAADATDQIALDLTGLSDRQIQLLREMADQFFELNQNH